MKKSILILGAAVLPLVACNGPEKGTERLDSDASAATDEVQEELDPNDPNVLVCPVTGAMQRLEPATPAENMDGRHFQTHSGIDSTNISGLEEILVWPGLVQHCN